MGKRFRIAFSFAGEKRNFISAVADILAKQFGAEKILYDKYHESEFARPDLAFYLPKLYKDNCDLVVTVFCKAYIAKEWCGLVCRPGSWRYNKGSLLVIPWRLVVPCLQLFLAATSFSNCRA